MPLNNTPANFTTFGNYTVWLNTVTENLFWTYVGIIIPYLALFMLFRRFGTISAFTVTSYIMFAATWMLPLIFGGIVSPVATVISFALLLISTALLLFIR